jgi:MarR family transcriptional regulator for hemolysin
MKKEEPSIFDISEFSLGRKLGLLGKLYFATLSSRLKHLGIEKHFSVLVLIDTMGNKCSQKFIASVLHIDKTMMVGVIDDLGSKGFIKRIQNPDDRREYWIHLTEKAKKHMPEIKKVVNEMNKTAFMGMTPAEAKKFHTQLYTIYKNVKKLSR